MSWVLFFLGSINFIFLNPLIRISSSIKSSSRFTSGLQLGTSTFIDFLLFLHLKPKEDKILSVSFIEIEIPISFSNFSTWKLIILFFWFVFPVIWNLLASPPQIFKISSVANSSPSLTELGSIPLSNLYFASVLILSSLEVFLIEDGLK